MVNFQGLEPRIRLSHLKLPEKTIEMKLNLGRKTKSGYLLHLGNLVFHRSLNAEQRVRGEREGPDLHLV